MGHFVQEADLVAILKKMINTKYFDIISDMVFYCVFFLKLRIPLSKRLAMKHVVYILKSRFTYKLLGLFFFSVSHSFKMLRLQ